MFFGFPERNITNVFRYFKILNKFLKDFRIPAKKVKDLNDLVKYEYKNR